MFSRAMSISLVGQNAVLCGNGLTLSLLMTTQEASVDSIDQDQTVQNKQSDL